MSYFAPYLDKNGLHIPTYADRLESLLSSYRTIFGSDINLAESSPDYQLLSVFARALDDFTSLLVALFSSRNPNYAVGTALDLLLPLHGLFRSGATHSTAYISLTGTPNTTLSAAPRILDNSGHIWSCSEGIHMDAEGRATVLATCETPGAVSAPADSITSLVSSISNLSSATNPDPATPGVDAETDASARSRLRLAVAAPSASTLESIRSEVLSQTTASDCKIYENATSETDEKGIPPHSFCLVVRGGNKTRIGEIICQKKAPGIGTYGNQTVNVTDSFGFAHEICFKRVSTQYYTLNIYIKARDGFDEANMIQAIRSAIYQHVSALGIGEDLVIPALYGIAYSADTSASPTFLITRIFANKLNEDTFASDVLSPEWDQRFALPSENDICIILES